MKQKFKKELLRKDFLKARKSQHHTIEQAAKETKLSRSWISMLEKREGVNIGADKLGAVCDYIGYSVIKYF